ncbi:hypothetical protein GCK72_011862 [Caenorhabditis remanei]|uniref:Uncharacterized protein n=1 Tax=Caenorhabditis remanei TaxID=31234 RepID=A0A6A5H8T4_CAERE|nr:hypothetical protein GCK72_011862 [Caenorhabditis remanei]KAF1763595.1 hypothetical protein GCK72_011862 [Caenorhabditis remanei]
MANEMRMFLMTKQGKEIQKKQERKTELLNDPRAFYQDHFVSMTYIPQNVEEKIPGRGLDGEGRWWATDVLRPHERELHLYNVRIEARDVEPPKSGFTVIYIDQFLKACRHLLPYSCKLSGCVWSE